MAQTQDGAPLQDQPRPTDSQEQPYFVPPQPGYYYVPVPMPTAARVPPRSTSLGIWGLACGIAAFLLPIFGIILIETTWRYEDFGRVLAFLAPLAAIVGIVLSSVAMSRRYTRRGFAIAGLVVGILGVLGVLSILVGALAYA
ncbi:DUF4190 domain-containing protein [Modestobacter excelsi]|uniref:DUF4190 domain-containing protein n=1 Tax=Modestobacter excelsi TaxID=2213161 RepID=UPI00110D053F|nr:DUF4190 domain-containing protein [Modestobacter excelsi]